MLSINLTSVSFHFYIKFQNIQQGYWRTNGHQLLKQRILDNWRENKLMNDFWLSLYKATNGTRRGVFIGGNRVNPAPFMKSIRSIIAKKKFGKNFHSARVQMKSKRSPIAEKRLRHILVYIQKQVQMYRNTEKKLFKPNTGLRFDSRIYG